MVECKPLNVGRNGIKHRGGGVNREGKNDIQGSPWDWGVMGP